MSVLSVLLLGAGILPGVVFEQLPSDANGPVNCPAPPQTIATRAGRTYECHPEEGSSAYRDVTPPDDMTLWRLPFGTAMPAPYGTASYHPPKAWPFRAVAVAGNPAGYGGRAYFYVFDKKGVIVDSSDHAAIGDRMMEVRVSGIRLWPTAQVFYRMVPMEKKVSASERSQSQNRIGEAARYAFIVDDGILCPALSESSISYWSDEGASPGSAGTYLNGHCGETKVTVPTTDSGSEVESYAYRGFADSGLDMGWVQQLHDQPEHPLVYGGQCYAFCVK